MRKAPEKDRSDRWMITYSDLMNLLLILFIVLYSMSKIDVQKASAVAQSIRKGFNAPVTNSQASGGSGGNAVSKPESQADDYSGFYDKLVALISQSEVGRQVEVVADENDVVITLKDTALYSPGSATMDETSLNLVRGIGNLLKEVSYSLILVEGNTDSDPIHTAEFRDNRDLSATRANNVARVLEDVGLPKNKIASIGWGEYNPVAPNDTPANKAKNRRVVLSIIRNTDFLSPSLYVQAKQLLELQSNGASSSSKSSS